MAELDGPVLSHAEVEDLAAGFVLGSLEPSEMAAVRQHLATCTEAHPELEALGGAVPAMALASPEVLPPSDLGARILATARAEAAPSASGAGADAAVAHGQAVAPRLVPVRDAPGPRVEPRGRGFGAWLDVLRRPAFGFAAVAAVLAVVLVGWNLQLQAQVSDLAAYRSGVVAVLDAASTPGGQLAFLTGGTGSGPNGLAAVTPDGRVAVAMRNLDPTSGSQVYEAWLIAGSSAPRPVGSFVVGTGRTGTLTASVQQAAGGAGEVIALTREPGPGATTPTLPIVAQGRAAAASS